MDAGSGYGAGSADSSMKGGYRKASPSQQGVRVLQPVLHCSKKGWGVASYSRSYFHPSSSQEFPEVCFGRRNIPISGSSVWPRLITLHFHEMHWCSSGSLETPGHLRVGLYQRLVDFSSIRADGSSALRCRSVSHEDAGVKAQHQKECAPPFSEDHFPRCSLGFDNNVSTIARYSLWNGFRNCWVSWRLRPM